MVELTSDIDIIICKHAEGYGLDYLKTIGKSRKNGVFNKFCCVFSEFYFTDWHLEVYYSSINELNKQRRAKQEGNISVVSPNNHLNVLYNRWSDWFAGEMAL